MESFNPAQCFEREKVESCTFHVKDWILFFIVRNSLTSNSSYEVSGSTEERRLLLEKLAKKFQCCETCRKRTESARGFPNGVYSPEYLSLKDTYNKLLAKVNAAGTQEEKGRLASICNQVRQALLMLLISHKLGGARKIVWEN